MKQVTFLSPAHPLRGGIAASTERLAQEMQRAGYQVTIYSFSLQYPDFLFPGKTQYTDDPPPKDLEIRSQINSINPLNWWRVGERIRKEQPDLVIVRFWIPFLGPSLGAILRRIRRNDHTKVIALADNIAPHERRPGDRPLTRYFLRAVDGFIVMSRAVAEDVRRFTPHKPIRYVPHPIYDNYGPPLSRAEALQELALSPQWRYLLFFGFIRPYKGLDLLLRAFARQDVQARPLKLIVAGEFYAEAEATQRLIDELGIRERVILHSAFIPNEAVRHYFGAADLVVQPYRSATQSGISQLAYHFERPMVVTAVGGLPEIVHHGKEGYVVPVEVAAIADAIEDFFANGRLEAMCEAVRMGKERFSWKNMVEGMEAVEALIERDC